MVSEAGWNSVIVVQPVGTLDHEGGMMMMMMVMVMMMMMMMMMMIQR